MCNKICISATDEYDDELFTLPTLLYPLLSTFSRVQESGLFFPNIWQRTKTV